MYYPQQSPGIAHKLPTHHDQNAWGRAATAAGVNHPILVPPGSQPVGVGVPPLPSPGYPLYTNGALQQHHPGHHPLSHAPMHQHHNSLSHYPSPPNGHAHQQQQQQQQQQHMLAQGSPAGQIISPHWQQQLLKCDMIRQSRSPHHRARQSALAARTIPKSAIPITNPNAKTPAPAASTPAPETPSKDTSETSSSDSSSDPSANSPSAGTVNHPSSTVAPIAAPRPTTIKRPENTWNSLDMGGVNIKNLPPGSGLFTFTFLTNLYLNHNSLSTIPPEISKLRHLELLDLSGNNLSSLPPELGMLTQLKELYLFDNQLTTLPPELGTLHQLQTMGIEGNPIDANLKAIVQKDGTPALVSYLRDNFPAPLPPPERQWKNLLTVPERDALANDPNTETINVLCYNILCEKYATEKLYGYTPSWALPWTYRKDLILKEILKHDTDLLCLQEVDVTRYEDFFLKHLEEHGYAGAYWPKSRAKTMNEQDRRLVDGCAIFYKPSRFQLVEKQLIEYSQVAMQRQDFKKTDDMFNRVLGKDHIAVICLLEDRHTGTRFVVANTHIHWDPAYCDVKLVQVALLLDEVEKAASRFAKYPPRPPSLSNDNDSEQPKKPQRPPPVYTDGTKIPVLVCGDFNSIPSSSVYDFLATGSLSANHPDFLSHTYGKYTAEGLKHHLNLKSAYAAPGAGGEGHVTNYTPSFQGELDYIWYSANNLSLNAVLGELDPRYLSKMVGFPNAHFPSDHVAIACELRVKPPRDTRQQPAFNNLSSTPTSPSPS